MDMPSFTPQILECATPSTKQKIRGLRRKRAAIACVACRKRKVRCDVAEHGLPCCNCELDQTECNIQTSRRKRFEPCYRQAGSSSRYPNHIPPTPVQSISTTPSGDEMSDSSMQQAYLNRTNESENNGHIETSPYTSDDLDGPNDSEWLRWLNPLPPGDITRFEMPFDNMRCSNCSAHCYRKFNDVLDGIRNAVDLLYEAMAISAQIMKNSQETTSPRSSLRNNGLDNSLNVEIQKLDGNGLSDSSLVSQLFHSGEDGVSSLSAGSPSVFMGNDTLDMFIGNTGGPEEMDPT